MIYRQATTADEPRIWEIILQAKAQMFREGKQQWTEAYPSPERIATDVERGYGHVLCHDDEVVAYGAVIFEGEAAYDDLEGEWLSNGPYVVVHRLAVADEAKRQGVGTRFMREVQQHARRQGVTSFKVDTNFDNFYMQRMLANLGFDYCGKVYYPQGERMAYEKLLGDICV